MTWSLLLLNCKALVCSRGSGEGVAEALLRQATALQAPMLAAFHLERVCTVRAHCITKLGCALTRAGWHALS